ncbi:MAG: M20/M25/M40 family metallo-hydrolase [Bryobacterales bacterium]|nr:M20/M25/M40 family metallo-hydrolase [Bryobacterales bacterium]
MGTELAVPAGIATLVSDLAQRRGVREPLEWFTREKRWINEQHAELCRIPAPTFLEHERAEWMAEHLRGFGCEVLIDRAGNVIAFPRSRRNDTLVALTAHLDTVIAPRNRDDIRVEADGKIHGPGVSDNGAGLAALLAVARAVTASPELEERHSDLVLVANVGEEGEGNLNGMRHLLSRQSPLSKRMGAFIVLDGAATDHITTQALGSRRFEITFSGPGGHSWSDFGTANPVHAVSRLVASLADTPLDGAPRSSLNCGIIDGGSAVNSIPQSALTKIDIRSESNERLEELSRIVTAAVERVQELENGRATGGRISSRIREIGYRPAARLADDSPILPYIRAVDSYLGIRSFQDCSSTDANVPLALGLPAVSIGAGGQGGGAHTLQEWFAPAGRDLGLKRILLTLCLLLRNPSLKPPSR